jgi:RNA polymerase sigma-70 factor, ECF subfamily
VDRDDLARYLAETLHSENNSITLAAERYLAFACARRAPQAIESFQSVYASAIDEGAGSVDRSAAFIDEVRQRVLELLFVDGPAGTPRILQYKGQGPLAAWLRIMAKRIALRLVSADRAERLVSDEALASELADTCDQELVLLRTHYSKLFREALVVAIRSLPPRDRLLLQMNLVGGISTVRISKMYRVNQSTISRQLQRAANKTFDLVRERLREELGIVSEELESLLAIIRSHIDMTLSCLEQGPSSETDYLVSEQR